VAAAPSLGSYQCLHTAVFDFVDEGAITTWGPGQQAVGLFVQSVCAVCLCSLFVQSVCALCEWEASEVPMFVW
jgi:hypothetical protein